MADVDRSESCHIKIEIAMEGMMTSNGDTFPGGHRPFVAELPVHRGMPCWRNTSWTDSSDNLLKLQRYRTVKLVAAVAGMHVDTQLAARIQRDPAKAGKRRGRTSLRQGGLLLALAVQDTLMWRLSMNKARARGRPDGV